MSEELTETCDNCGECRSLCACDICVHCKGKQFICTCVGCGACANVWDITINQDGLCDHCCDPRTGESFYDQMVADTRTYP